MDFDFTQEQRMFYNEVLKFGRKELAPRVQENDLAGRFDREAWQKLAEFGILGLHFPPELGGSGADVMTTVLASEALGEAGVDGGIMLSYGAHTFLCADTIFCHGTDAQKRKYVPKLAGGEWIGCMGLTEPNAGSDVAAMRTRAEKVGDKWVLNGAKTFITNGPIADVAVVYATSNPGMGYGGFTAFIVEKGTPGFTAGPKFEKLGVKTSYTSELFFENCEVPPENQLGQEGQGFFMAMQMLEWDRSALLAPMLGGFTNLLEKCARYAQQRSQFGKPIAKFQAIQHKLANIKIFTEAARSLVYHVAWDKSQGKTMNHQTTAVAKLFMGDWSLAPTNDAVTLFGGYGFCHEYDVERFFRDSRLAAIGGGTSEVQKLIISRML